MDHRFSGPRGPVVRGARSVSEARDAPIAQCLHLGLSRETPPWHDGNHDFPARNAKARSKVCLLTFRRAERRLSVEESERSAPRLSKNELIPSEGGRTRPRAVTGSGAHINQ